MDVWWSAIVGYQSFKIVWNTYSVDCFGLGVCQSQKWHMIPQGQWMAANWCLLLLIASVVGVANGRLVLAYFYLVAKVKITVWPTRDNGSNEVVFKKWRRQILQEKFITNK